MRAFTQHTGLVGPMDRANVDTDIIIPKQFLKTIQRTGLGQNLFDELRYVDEGVPGKSAEHREKRADFPLNQSRYQGASILLTRRNFGCGSSREHAPWALDDYGFRAVIAPSFADIFYNNCFKNGLLPIVLSEDAVEQLFTEMYANEGYRLKIDLATQSVTTPAGTVFTFELDAFRKHCLLNGLDDIGLTLQDQDKIRAYEQKRQKECPWLFNAIRSELI